MALILNCPITGLQVRYKYGTSEVKAESIHPVCRLSVTQLNQIPTPANHQECIVLLAGYLSNLKGKVNFESPILPYTVSKAWIIENLGKLRSLANWLELSKSDKILDAIPGFNFTKTTSEIGLNEWLEICNTTRQYYTYTVDTDAKTRRIAEENLARKFRESGSARIAVNRVQIDYLGRSLAGHSKPRRDQIIQVVFRPDKFEVATLQDTRAFCQEYLQEATESEFNNKQRIVKKLDLVIWDKISLQEILGVEGSTTIADDFRSKYTIEIDGIEHENNAFPRPMKKADILPQLPTLPSVKPLRENFKTDGGFNLAMKVWSRKNEK